ncbi:MAG: hypothetical protein AABY14_03120 [Nanoarchaeota archaeon]
MGIPDLNKVSELGSNLAELMQKLERETVKYVRQERLPGEVRVVRYGDEIYGVITDIPHGGTALISGIKGDSVYFYDK